MIVIVIKRDNNSFFNIIINSNYINIKVLKYFKYLFLFFSIIEKYIIDEKLKTEFRSKKRDKKISRVPTHKTKLHS